MFAWSIPLAWVCVLLVALAAGETLAFHLAPSPRMGEHSVVGLWQLVALVAIADAMRQGLHRFLWRGEGPRAAASTEGAAHRVTPADALDRTASPSRRANEPREGREVPLVGAEGSTPDRVGRVDQPRLGSVLRAGVEGQPVDHVNDVSNQGARGAAQAPARPPRSAVPEENDGERSACAGVDLPTTSATIESLWRKYRDTREALVDVEVIDFEFLARVWATNRADLRKYAEEIAPPAYESQRATGESAFVVGEHRFPQEVVEPGFMRGTTVQKKAIVKMFTMR